MTTTIGTGVPLRVNGVDVGVVTEWTLELTNDWPDYGNRPIVHATAEAITTEGTVRFRLGGGTNVNPATQRLTIDETLAQVEIRLATLNAAAEAHPQPAPRPNPLWTIDATVFGDITRTYLAGYTPENYAASKARLAERTAADKKAMELLVSHLSPTQKAQLRKSSYFHLKGEKIIYRISRSGDVGTFKPYGTFCVYPVTPDGQSRTAELPGPDLALTIKMLIEADEAEFLRTANWSGALGNEGFSLAKLDISGTSAVHPVGGYLANVYGKPELGSLRPRPGTDFRTVYPYLTYGGNITFDET